MTYAIAFKPSADKQFSKLPKTHQQRIFTAIEHLAFEPRPSGVKKLQSTLDLYRIRVGDYRVIYAIEDQQLKILVLTIGHRKDVYKGS